jgi:Helix-turn-helix domain
MQGLPKHSREPGEILGVEDHATLEDLRKAYLVARERVQHSTKQEDLGTTSREHNDVVDVEWAYKQLVARFVQDASADEDAALSAVLLPGLAPDALGDTPHLGNVLVFATRKETAAHRPTLASDDEDATALPYFSIDTRFDDDTPSRSREQDGIPELREALARAAAPFARGASTAAPSLAPPTAAATPLGGASGRPRLRQAARQALTAGPGRRAHSPMSGPPSLLADTLTPSLPLDSDLIDGETSRTIRSVIGGVDRAVVNIVARASHRDDVQETIRGLLAGAEVLSGPLLRTLRQAMGVEIKEIGARTRMSLVQIEALEEDAFDRLPAPVYYRGFVVSYLKYLGVDRPDLADALTENYRAQLRARYLRGNR